MKEETRSLDKYKQGKEVITQKVLCQKVWNTKGRYLKNL